MINEPLPCLADFTIPRIELVDGDKLDASNEIGIHIKKSSLQCSCKKDYTKRVMRKTNLVQIKKLLLKMENDYSVVYTVFLNCVYCSVIKFVKLLLNIVY